MPSLAEIRNDPNYINANAETKLAIFDKYSANDADFTSANSETKAAIRQKFGLSGSKPKALEAESVTPFAIDKFKAGVAGTLSLPSLLADTLLSPATALVKGGVAIANKFRGEDAQLKSPDWLQYTQKANPALREAVGARGLPVPKDEYGKESKSNEYIGALAEFAGGGLIPGAAVISRAAGAANKARAVVSELAVTAAGATGSVEGKEIGKELAPMVGVDPSDGAAAGEALGSFLGLSVPAVVNLTAKGTNKAGNFVQDKTGIGGGIGKEAQKDAANVMASKDIGAAIEASPAAKPNMAEAVALQKEIPGFNPTLGQATAAPGVIAIENRVAAQSAESLSKAAQREADNSAALLNYEQQKFPNSGSPIAPVKARAIAIQNRLTANLDGVEARIQGLADRVDKGVDSAAIGERLRVLRDEARTAAGAIKNQKYADTYRAADEAGIKEPVADIQAMMKKIADDGANVAQAMPETFSVLNGAIKKYSPEKSLIVMADGAAQPPAGTLVPFEAVHSMQKKINADLGAAVVSGDAEKAFFIRQVKDVIDAKVARYEGPEFGDVAAKLNDANDFYKTKYNAVFNEGVGGRIGPRAQTKFGELTQDADIVKKLVFNPGNRRGVEEFFSIYGVNKEAAQLLKNGAYDMLAVDVVRDGVIKPGLVEAFARKHKNQLDLMPGFRDEITNIDKLNDSLLARRQSVFDQQKAFDKSVVSKISQTEDIAATINSALTNPKEMRVLSSQAQKTPGGQMSLARSIADAVAEQKNPYQFLIDNQGTLKPAMDRLGKDHYQNLTTLARAKEIGARTRAPTDVNLSKLQDLGEQAIGTSGKGILSRMLAVEKGYMGAPYVAFDLGGRYIYKVRTEEANRLMEAAIYDPALASALLNMRHQSAKKAVNNLQHHAMSHGIRVLSTQADEE